VLAERFAQAGLDVVLAAGITSPHVQRVIDEGIAPAAAADLVADAIAADQFWVLTDPHFTEMALDRWQRIAEGHNPLVPRQPRQPRRVPPASARRSPGIRRNDIDGPSMLPQRHQWDIVVVSGRAPTRIRAASRGWRGRRGARDEQAAGGRRPARPGLAWPGRSRRTRQALPGQVRGRWPTCHRPESAPWMSRAGHQVELASAHHIERAVGMGSAEA
jgi:hypothetical protein